MNQNPRSHGKALASLHVAVVLFGLSGLFGKTLILNPITIVSGRTFFASATLIFFLSAIKQRALPADRRDFAGLGCLGAVLALHWWTFFYAIKLSTVAIGLLGYAAFPMFVTFLEPLLFKEKLRRFDLLTSAAIMIGLIAVAWPIDLMAGRTAGVFWGMVSGLLFAVLSLLNRKLVQQQHWGVMALYQNLFACLILLPFALILEPLSLSWRDLGMLLLLGALCTAVAHGLFIFSLTHVRAQLAGIVAALEPLYGIVFAFFLLGEIPQASAVFGGLLIIGTTIVAMRRRITG